MDISEISELSENDILSAWAGKVVERIGKRKFRNIYKKMKLTFYAMYSEKDDVLNLAKPVLIFDVDAEK